MVASDYRKLLVITGAFNEATRLNEGNFDLKHWRAPSSLFGKRKSTGH